MSEPHSCYECLFMCHERFSLHERHCLKAVGLYQAPGSMTE
nr:MAG TPA: hypothetical protein [Caudoviricetes sp.]